MRKLMWFTIGYALSCAVGTYLMRGNGMLVFALVCGLLMAGLVKFREHPVCKRAMVLALGSAVGCLANERGCLMRGFGESFFPTYFWMLSHLCGYLKLWDLFSNYLRAS